jgi:hypothetical protein
VTLRARWVMLRARWVMLRARWVTLIYRWVMLRARWVMLRARWVTLISLFSFLARSASAGAKRRPASARFADMRTQQVRANAPMQAMKQVANRTVGISGGR